MPNTEECLKSISALYASVIDAYIKESNREDGDPYRRFSVTMPDGTMKYCGSREVAKSIFLSTHTGTITDDQFRSMGILDHGKIQYVYTSGGPVPMAPDAT